MSYHQKWTLRAVVLLVALVGAIWAVRQQHPNSAAAPLLTDLSRGRTTDRLSLRHPNSILIP